MIVGAPDYDGPEVDEGAAFVYHGSSSGPSAVADWSGQVDQAGARVGRSVATAGDVNGDGYADVIVGAYRYSDGETGEGGAFVFLGSSGGLSTSYASASVTGVYGEFMDPAAYTVKTGQHRADHYGIGYGD